MGVLRLNRRTPPKLPIEIFGPVWAPWITTAAEAAACPPDYVAAPLLASASVLIGHARWGQATPGWAEPPHLDRKSTRLNSSLANISYAVFCLQKKKQNTAAHYEFVEWYQR